MLKLISVEVNQCWSWSVLKSISVGLYQWGVAILPVYHCSVSQVAVSLHFSSSRWCTRDIFEAVVSYTGSCISQSFASQLPSAHLTSAQWCHYLESQLWHRWHRYIRPRNDQSDSPAHYPRGKDLWWRLRWSMIWGIRNKRGLVMVGLQSPIHSRWRATRSRNQQ